MSITKEPIKLRKRITSKGFTSLYLDIYLNGRRSYEFLKLYLIPEKSREDKRKNIETLNFAEAIRAQRVIELQNNEYGFKQKSKENTLFFEYYRVCAKRVFRENSKGTWETWCVCLKHLERYEPNHQITFKSITPRWIQGFRNYLESTTPFKNYKLKGNPLSNNTKASYFNTLRAFLNQACKEAIIQENPMNGIKNFKAEESKRMYLTFEEVKKLVETPCSHDSVKKAFLFSCLTGLRRSDIIKMTWGEVQEQFGFIRIIFRQKKTKGQEYLDITPQAIELMGSRKEASERVFENIYMTNYTNKVLKKWVEKAGIKKEITFHCGRHTFATMMLDLGTDIYTVSKLLGHRDLSTTQVYAKVLDKNKQAAVASIPSILENKHQHIENNEY